MKKSLFIACLIAIAVSGLIGCKNGPSGGKSNISKLDQEAVDMAKQYYFSGKIIECDGLTYMRVGSLYKTGQHFRTKNRGTFKVQSIPLSEADRMNGVEWFGGVEFDANGPSQELWLYTNGVGGFREWGNMRLHDAVTVKKKNGQWEVSKSVPSSSQISCSEVHRQ